MRRYNTVTLLAACCLGLAPTACDIPRDQQRTTALVRETGTVRLGWIDDAEMGEHAEAALKQLQQRTNARLEISLGDSEKLLADLADGKIDLAYGTLAMDSPWSKEVYFGGALGWRARPPKHEAVPRFAMRNGENGWIMLVEEAARP